MSFNLFISLINSLYVDLYLLNIKVGYCCLITLSFPQSQVLILSYDIT